jgi:hypothetical protein
VFSPVDPHVLFYAANVVFKTVDGGHSWQTISGDLTRPHPGVPASLGSMAAEDAGAEKQRGVVYSLAPSFHNIDTIWAGTDEGLIRITTDGGKNWKDITPPALTPWSKVTQLEASHFDDQSAYASVSRFRVNDLTPYIYRTHDGGKTWQTITSGLPNDAPIDTVREDPVRKGLLFAGSETSVWASFDDGGHWQSLQLNLPHTSMRDLCIHGSDLIVATHGRSFWIMDDITPLEQMKPIDDSTSLVLFNPRPAVEWKTDSSQSRSVTNRDFKGQNPQGGTAIRVWAKADMPGAKIEFLQNNNVVSVIEPCSDTLRVGCVDIKAGMNSFQWNLLKPAPAGRGGRNGGGGGASGGTAAASGGTAAGAGGAGRGAETPEAPPVQFAGRGGPATGRVPFIAGGRGGGFGGFGGGAANGGPVEPGSYMVRLTVGDKTFMSSVQVLEDIWMRPQ